MKQKDTQLAYNYLKIGAPRKFKAGEIVGISTENHVLKHGYSPTGPQSYLFSQISN